jgi:hypothetical protein
MMVKETAGLHLIILTQPLEEALIALTPIEVWFTTLFRQIINYIIMKNIPAILIVALVLFACKKEEPVSYNIDGSVYIKVTDKSGMDLLNPSNPGAFLEWDIKIFYLTNGVKKEVNNANRFNPKNFHISEKADSQGKFYMTLSPNIAPDEEYPVTYIQWSETDTDTLKCDVFRAPGLESIKNVWINDSLVFKWEDYAKGTRNFEIIK